MRCSRSSHRDPFGLCNPRPYIEKNRFRDNMSSEYKKNLLGVLDRAISSNSSAQHETQQHLQQLARDGEMTKAFRDVVQSLPSDDVLPEMQWQFLQQDYTDMAQRMEAYKTILSEAAPLLSATTAAATLTTTAATRMISSFITKGDVPKLAFSHLEEVIYRPTLFGEVVDRMKSFGLHMAGPRARAPVELLVEANEALTKPTGQRLAPTAILLPARSAIEETLNRLVRRLLEQRRTGNARAKVLALGEQCGLAGATAEEFDRLGNQINALINTLSGAKDNVVADADVRRLFSEALRAIDALITKLDVKAFREDT